jgi:hypothetical protein
VSVFAPDRRPESDQLVQLLYREAAELLDISWRKIQYRLEEWDLTGAFGADPDGEESGVDPAGTSVADSFRGAHRELCTRGEPPWPISRKF